jgi:hypothetical protein
MDEEKPHTHIISHTFFHYLLKMAQRALEAGDRETAEMFLGMAEEHRDPTERETGKE